MQQKTRNGGRSYDGWISQAALTDSSISEVLEPPVGISANPNMRITPRMAAWSLLSALLIIGMTGCVAPTRDRVNADGLNGKVMAGYQGWFNAEGDGGKRGYNHWSTKGAMPGPETVRVDMWPDLTEYSSRERYPTDFRHQDGSIAEVFSSYNRPTVVRHFKWMEEHGIDGVFLQRFINSLKRGNSLAHNNHVLANVRAGARKHGRVYALMYDLSSLEPGQADVLIDDWKRLLRDTKMTRDRAYLHHEGKPLIALWGCGFHSHDKPRPSMADWQKIVEFLKNDQESGGLAIMLGVPSGWRTQTRDSIKDADLHEVLALADVISPWTPGRYKTPEAATKHARTYWEEDVVWCEERGIDFLPVAFPGFSWANMKPGAELNAIPRAGGQFLWSQIAAAKRSGADMLYIAMFDEVDEGTAIFKVTNNPPVGEGAQFATYEGLPSDHYLKIAGKAGPVIRGEVPVMDDLPDLNPERADD